MILKDGFFYILAMIALSGVNGNDGSTELYSKILKSHNYLVPPSSSNISVSVNVELINLLQLDTKNQEMTFTGIINLKWSDSTLSWNRKEFPQVNRVSVPSDKIWTPNTLIWNSRSKNMQSSGDDLFIAADGQVHWPIFGEFKTACTIDVTYYPFDQQTCIVKIGSIDRSIIFDYEKNSIDMDQFYMSVFWDIVAAPAYLNVYTSDNVDDPLETDVTYYLVIKRKTHWLSEVCPLLVFAFMTIIPAMVTNPMKKLILQVFCMAGLFILHMDLMHKLPPTSLVTPSASKFIVSLILYNLIHLTLTTVMNNRRGCFQRIVQQIPFDRMLKFENLEILKSN
ncbi:acetylcholine receptor subunit beta-like 1 isoform X2 [Bradysia coprophila]|uniref:acetylcholine receptor subunit beta-like 1 isoform X2 n=1 Tax=Bradysia coprophila TaxID=38358 RepID=UPI00187DA757|nr:acetylcholine receptor subunit beta-like 1 isoform X2 [Bradysia coprophila]